MDCRGAGRNHDVVYREKQKISVLKSFPVDSKNEKCKIEIISPFFDLVSSMAIFEHIFQSMELFKMYIFDL